MRRIAFIIDDENDIVTMIMRALTEEGWSVIGFDDPRNALEFLVQNPALPVSLQITDVRMPTMNGLIYMKAVNALGRRIPTVITSGYYDEELVILDDHTTKIDKPFSMETLMFAVNFAIKKVMP